MCKNLVASLLQLNFLQKLFHKMTLETFKVKNAGKTANITLHLLFWGVLIILLLFRDYQYYDRFKSYSMGYMLLGSFTHLAVVMTMFYVNYKYIVARHFRARRFKKFALYIFLLWMVGIVCLLVDSYLWYAGLNFTMGDKHRPWTTKIWTNRIIGATFISFFYLWSSTQIRIMIDWFRSAEVQKELENQRLKAELSMLKLQVSPHFLFNTLNNIYALAFQQRPQAPEAILKLSDIMRYMLYEANAEKVSLQKEITYIQNFIDLNKLRLRHTEVHFNLCGDYIGKQIAPMLLLPLVENAFKYGVSAKNPSVIDIDLKVADNQLIFSTQNQIFQQNSVKRPEEGGIGLNNTRKRLEFMYPGQYEFDTVADNGVYYTLLKVRL
ncbi:signaling protein without kinase domain [Microscilla marina ATCC 23134]|uniref:Signaling protein without kinase domain n=2 Tax=Microscilla marina TaxID=1027 RepID=A1ZR57_MICM2|nr:signaling protein without kinase domain [Microscilla marina ATCC 23134]